MHAPLLAPSLLAGNHAALAESLAIPEALGLNWIHLDIMDGHFVPNLTFGPQTVADLRKGSKLFFDTHLMLDEPHRYVEAFAQAGADLITVHVEPDYPIAETLEKIKSLGCQTGISLNPDTPAETLLPYLAHVDLVLVMTVQPGFGGQSFRRDVLGKIEQIHAWRSAKALDFRLEVDGGINLDTAEECRIRGVDTFVAGSAFYKAQDRAAFAASIERQ